MLCRTSTLTHPPSGVTVPTPLLIPSFSSKGFSTPTNDGKSEVNKIFATAAEFITETCLISAYDIFYKHLPNPDNLACTPNLIFLDSGGYEVSGDYGYSATSRPFHYPEDWSLDRLQSVVSSWPDHIPAVFVTYDHPTIRQPFASQLTAALDFLSEIKQHLSLFLLKPETRHQGTLDSTLTAAFGRPNDLGRFDIVGVTEKELGTTMMNRMLQLARLRLAMDDADIHTPIHVFGALDPVSVCLYYISGAEIFDGLTWLRYGYKDGLAIYTHNFGVTEYDLHVPDDVVRSRAISSNYYATQALQNRLLDFRATRDFRKLEPHDGLISDALDSLRTRLKGRL